MNFCSFFGIIYWNSAWKCTRLLAYRLSRSEGSLGTNFRSLFGHYTKLCTRLLSSRLSKSEDGKRVALHEICSSNKLGHILLC